MASKLHWPDCVEIYPVQCDGYVHLQYKQTDLNLVILCCGLYFSPLNFVTEHGGLECLCQAWSAKLGFFLLTSLTWDVTLVYLGSVLNPQSLPGLYCRFIQPCCLFVLTWKPACSFGLNLKLTLYLPCSVWCLSGCHQKLSLSPVHMCLAMMNCTIWVKGTVLPVSLLTSSCLLMEELLPLPGSLSRPCN